MDAGLEAIDTRRAIKNSVSFSGGVLMVKDTGFDLRNVPRLIIVGVGKCSLEAGLALEEILGERISGGIIVDPTGTTLPGKLEFIKGDHPLPTQKNLDATKKIIALLDNLTENDLVIFIISGGGSTILCQPTPGFDFEKEGEIFKLLSQNGADIQEMNTLRKHLSLARGGGLAKYAHPAKVISLIFSDVPGRGLEFVASGPTIKDTTTIKEAKTVADKYNLSAKMGFKENWLIETPKTEQIFNGVRNFLLMSNQIALGAMAVKAKELGYEPEIISDQLTGEARIVGREINQKILSQKGKKALLWGGETTVTVKGPGKGGRNQELILAALGGIKEKTIIAAINSDGWDNTDHAGALCDIITLQEAQKLGLAFGSFLDTDDSYNFFLKTGDYIETGYTGANVSDIVLALGN